MFFALVSPALATEIDFASLSKKKIWLNQLQYRKTFFSSLMDGRDAEAWKSETDGDGFFITKQGRTSPEAELRATYELFLTDPEKPWGHINQAVICAFPTRKKFLEEELKIHFKKVPCPDKDQWQSNFRGSQLYLIFSDAFPNNPASMFGHTFMLFSKHDPPDSAEGLMDHAVNFSADTSSQDEKSLLYTLKGVFGGYPARYRIYSFYQMVNQYVHWDSRDLWYLKIPLDQGKIDRLLDHIWEIFTTTHFDYYFMNENCSYRLLAALDYADPELNLVDEFHYSLPIYYVSPIATYKAAQSRYQIRSEYYSPSIQKSLKRRTDALSPNDRTRFHFLRQHMESIYEEKNIEVLDSVIAYFDYRKRIASADYLPETIITNLDLALRQRAQIQSPSPPEAPFEKPASPTLAHKTRSFWLGASSVDGRGTASLGGKIGYHDLLSPTDGFQRWSHLGFGEFEVQYVNSQAKIQTLTAVDIISFFPIESYERKLSWRASGGFNQDYGTFIQGGGGFSWQTKSEKELIYTFVSPTVSSKDEWTHRRGFLIEGELGFIKEFAQRAKIWLLYRDIMRDPSWNFSEGLEQGVGHISYFLSRNDELRISFFQNIHHNNWAISWHRNF